MAGSDGSEGREPRRVAVVDIGSNSTRLLVADVLDGRIEELERRSVVTRLARGVDLSGQLSTEAIDAVCDTIADYASIYEEMGAERIVALATSAVRDASNGEAFIAELRERFDLGARILDGDQEAQLTYAGATAGRPPPNGTLVVDIGGGSTELVVGTGEDVAFRTSVQAGVVRQTERHVQSDPPQAAELEELATDVRGLLDEAMSEEPSAHAADGIAVAGTATSLAAIDMELEPYDAEKVQGHRMGLEPIQRVLSRLASMPLIERREVPGLHPDRAPTIVAGIVILIEVMRAFGLVELEFSEHDILWGAALRSEELVA